MRLRGIAPVFTISLVLAVVALLGASLPRLSFLTSVVGERWRSSMVTKKRAHHALALGKKVEIIDDFDSGFYTKLTLGMKHVVPNNSLTRILHDKEKLRDTFESLQFGPQRKILRLANHEELEKCLGLWLRRAQSQNIRINEPLRHAKAKELNSSAWDEAFLSREGWLTRFKERNGLVFRTISGEATAADVTACHDCHAQVLLEILHQFNPDDIYNVDDKARFFKLLQSKSLTLKSEWCAGGKLSKESLTVLVGTNMSGSAKLKLVIIGK